MRFSTRVFVFAFRTQQEAGSTRLTRSFLPKAANQSMQGQRRRMLDTFWKGELAQSQKSQREVKGERRLMAFEERWLHLCNTNFPAEMHRCVGRLSLTPFCYLAPKAQTIRASEWLFVYCESSWILLAGDLLGSVSRMGWVEQSERRLMRGWR